ncbi:unnamed protein product [Paramecium sonneborni]|uniref:poly(ADP-ribose) glycohydrolase n=1 Tax=Paramecium sonneborni TaxID=65129 RepID=A0A8S1RI26_9CILI|nr:unnamed protein product [Paramecium sonneborni]
MNLDYDITQPITPGMLRQILNQDEILKDLFLELKGLEHYIYQILIDQDRLKQLLNDNITKFQKEDYLTLSREQIFTLIMMMYFNMIKKNCYSSHNFYLVNMEKLKNMYRNNSLIYAKLQCIKNYIRFFFLNKNIIGSQLVKFIRNSINENEFETLQSQKQYEIQLDIKLTESEKNEDHQNSTVVDFADENIGGLTLDEYNCAQEEILMLVFTEALVCMLFIPPMKQNQAVLIQDLIKYNHYKGYEKSFQFVPQEINVRSFYNILAIDAKHFSQFENQFLEQNINRELLKSYAGFELAIKNAPRFPISTGRWGCGIFRGDPFLKLLIQLLAFALALKKNQQKDCQIIINTVGDKQLYQFGKLLVSILKKDQFNLAFLTNLIFSLKNKEFSSSDEIISYVNSFQFNSDSQIESLNQNQHEVCFNKIKQNCIIILLIVFAIMIGYILYKQMKRN